MKVWLKKDIYIYIYNFASIKLESLWNFSYFVLYTNAYTHRFYFLSLLFSEYALFPSIHLVSVSQSDLSTNLWEFFSVMKILVKTNNYVALIYHR